MVSGWRCPIYKKILENPKVWHNGTADRYPNFNIYQDIQSQNDFSIMQLNSMDFGSDVLWVQFRVDKICEGQEVEAPVKVAQTCERQEAITVVNTAGKCFFCNGGRDAQYDGQWVHCCRD